jgi:pyridoxine 5-phosphate synthase
MIMITLNVNIDHIATLRQARGGSEPDPVTGALISELAGATGIVAHLREDRRHVNDRDVKLLRQVIKSKLDLEMAATEEIISIALELVPDLVTIVPEKRMELTTEGGLNVAADFARFEDLCNKMHSKNIEVSFFIEPDEYQIDACKNSGSDMVELHTGTYASAKNNFEINNEFKRIKKASEYAASIGLKIAAGHGLNYVNIAPICRIPQICEMSIGHAIIAKAVFTGLENAVKEMVDVINRSVSLSKFE